MNIQSAILKIVTFLSSLHLVYCIKRVELYSKSSDYIQKQSNWKVGDQIPIQTEQLQQFGISMWFKTRYNQIDKGKYSLLDISTHSDKQIFGMDINIEYSELILLTYASEMQYNLKLNCRNDEWMFLVISFQQEVFVQVFSVMNEKYQEEKIKYKTSFQFLIEDVNVFIANSPQIIKYNNIFLYYSEKILNVDFLQSYIINATIQRNDCKRIQKNKKLVSDYIRYQCSVSPQKFNSQNQIIHISNKIIHIISFNLVEYEYQQNDRNILFKFNNQFSLLISQNNDKQYLLFQLNKQSYTLGLIDNYQSQITLQIEFSQFQEYQYFIQYYQNQYFKGETRIKKMIPFKDYKQQHLIQGQLFEELQVINMIILTNFKISQSEYKNQQINGCVLKAILITENIKDSHICLFYQVQNDNYNISEHNIQSQHQKRKLATDPYIHGSNMRSIIRNRYTASQFKSKITQAQSINTVLIVGYFMLTQQISEKLYLPIITVGVQSDYYNIFNIYLKSNTYIELKYINDTANQIYTTSKSVNDMTNKWFGIGLLYSKTNSQVKLVITDQQTYKFDGPSEINSASIPSSTSTLDVCITCTIEGGVFGHFDGSVSSVKIIYDVSYSSINSYLFFNEYSGINKASILSASFNINTYNRNSEYNLGKGFDCNQGYAFYEGVCIDQNNCKTLIQDSNIYSSFEMGKFYDSSSNKCLNCSSNCVVCSSASVCTTCRPSYKTVNGSCIRCDNINRCISSCSGQQFDPINQMCVDYFSTSLQQLTNLLLSSRIINDNSDVVVENSPSFSSINDQIIHCYIDVDNNPMTLYSFLGGVQFTTTTKIKKSFSQIPKGYQKSVSFYVLFYGSGNPSNLLVKINNNLTTLDSQSVIVSNKISCSGSGTQTQSIFQVKFVIYDNQNIFDLEIQNTSSQWGIRNLNVEISKCHPTCGSCSVGGSIDDCTTCDSMLTINKFQCNCPYGFYIKYQNCFDSPCVVCSSCTIQDCLKCEDITGICTQCKVGFSIKDGQCIQNTSCNNTDSVYFNQCGVSQETGFTHFKQDRIVQYGDYWKFYNFNVSYFEFDKRKYAPLISENHNHTLQMTLPNYFSYHYQITIDIEIFQYQSIDETDFLTYMMEIKKFLVIVFTMKKSQFQVSHLIMLCLQENLHIQRILINQISFLMQIRMEIQMMKPRCHPMCKTCTGNTADTCINCIDNASVANRNCQCKDGYYFSLIRFPSTNDQPGNCLKCNSACQKCTGPSYSDCTQCQDGYENDDNDHNVCKYKCKDGKYWKQETQQCVSCHACCRTCVSDQNNNCHDCFLGYSFRITDNSCSLFNAQCQSCTVASSSLCGGNLAAHNNCLSNGWVVYDVNTCVQCGKFVNSKCGGDYSQIILDFCKVKGYQFNYDSNNCSSCITLTSGNTLDTGNCGRIEIKERCNNYGWKFFDDNKCINCNPNSTTFNNCICHNSCSTCSRYQNPFYCKTCIQSYYLYKDSQCLPNCPNGSIINGLKCVDCTEKQMPTCVSCYRTCLTCDPFVVSTIPNSCTACSTLTRELVDKKCQCLDLEDTREQFHECSYKNTAVLNAILSNLTPLLTIYFGKILSIPNTFQKDVYSTFMCQYLFTAGTKQILGSASECQISGQYISVKLDNNSTIFDGELINFEKNKLSFVNSSSILIDRFLNNMVTQNQITGQIKISFDYLSVGNSCDDINIKFKNILNDAQRGFKQIKWSLSSYLPSDQTKQTILENLLQVATAQKKLDLIITKGIIKPDIQVKIRFDYTLKANVTDYEEFNLSVKPEKKIFLDTKSSIISPFFRLADQKFYQLQIFFQNKYFQFIFKSIRRQTIILVFTSVIKICSSEGEYQFIEPLDFSISSDECPDKNYKNSNYLKQEYQIEFQPYTIQPGKIIFNINAKLVSDSFTESKIRYEFDIQSSPLYTKIIGGNGYFNYKKPVTIDGKVRDNDIQNETDPQGIDIQWKCNDPSSKNTCKSKDGSLVTFTPNILTITIKEFSFEPYTIVVIQLIGKKSPNRQSTDEITILLSELDLPALGVDINTIDLKKETVNLNEEIFVQLNYNSAVNVDLLSYSGTINYENNVVGIIKFDYTSLRFQIWNYFSNFKRDSNKFEIRFNVFNPEYYMPSMFLATFNLNFPPNKCKFTVNPNIGNSVETKFNLSLFGCEDENLPIYFQYFYYQSSYEFEFEKKNPLQVKRRQLNDKSQNQMIETSLPSGKILVLAQAIDSKKAIFNTTLEINVQLKIYDESTYISLIQQTLDSVGKVEVASIISGLSIISDDILKRDELKSSTSLNAKKIEILNLLDTLQKNLSPLSTFSTTADKAKASLTQSGITYSSSESQNLLTQLIDALDDSSKLQQSNLEISKEKLKQKLFDSFQVVDTLGNQDSNTQSSDKMIELTDKIGGYLFKNILPNEDPIYFQGEQLKIFGTQMTEKYVCSYFLCEGSTPTDSKKQSSIYNLKKSEFNTNPYSQDDSFLNYTNTLKQQNPNISILNFPIITPTISNHQNNLIDSFPKPAILNFPIKSSSNKKNVTCLQKKQNKGWTKNGCYNLYHQKSNSYLCVCDELSPTTVIDDLEELINNKNIQTAFSSDGVSNIANFREFYKYVAFWLLSFQTILFIIFYYKGLQLDSLDFLSKSDQIKNLKSTEQVVSKKSQFSKNKVVPQNVYQNDIEESDVKKNETLQTEQIQNNTPQLISQQHIQNDNVSLKPTHEATKQPLIVQNINSLNILTQKDITTKQTLEFKESGGMEIYQLNHDSQNQNLTSRQNFSSNLKPHSGVTLKQYEESSVTSFDNTERKAIQKNEKNASPNNNITRIESSNKFNQLPIYKQVIFFHNFFGIFLLFNPNVSRTLRFLMFYLRSIHSLCIAVIFDQSYSLVQRIAIAIFNALSIIIVIKIFEIGFSIKNIVVKIVVRIIAVSIILGYYYIILSIVSGQEPGNSNMFFTTFILFYVSDLFIFSFCSASIQRIIARRILKNVELEGIKQKLYDLIQLKFILISIK